ncbi:uncharacterized protein Bfra_002559 [Botrytis fragariae]|uniref:Uncharacterized protein n=1 Tax=Botrytis fragariae TaxID=1964551 RepID=A0A8H6AZ53_9HELO|nr:uncharacterized protein Bfra_002559 [Botrytis fragariae]KAF5876157.1 hypothetical protein Bfra_002559 [Botrytis fragariae]
MRTGSVYYYVIVFGQLRSEKHFIGQTRGAIDGSSLVVQSKGCIEAHICRRSAESNNLKLSALNADNTLAAFGEENQERMV